MILILIFFSWFSYRTASGFFSKKVAIVSLIFYASPPTFLVHGRLITTDVAAAGIFISAYYFLQSTFPFIFVLTANGLVSLMKSFKNRILRIAIFMLVGYCCFRDISAGKQGSGASWTWIFTADRLISTGLTNMSRLPLLVIPFLSTISLEKIHLINSITTSDRKLL